MPRKHQLSLQYFYICKYTVKYVPGDICNIIVMVFVSYECINGNVLIFTRAQYDRVQEMVLKESVGHILKGVMFLK